MTVGEQHASVPSQADLDLGRDRLMIATAKADQALDHLVLGRTLPEMFWGGVAKRGDKILLRQKKFGIWEQVTWNEAGQIVCAVGAGLIGLGLRPGECVSILANTVKEWLYSDMAILSAGGVCSGIYPTDAANQVEYLLSDSDSKYIFVEDEEQLDKVLRVRATLPDLRKIIVFDMKGLLTLDDEQVMSFEALREFGARYLRENPNAWEQRQGIGSPDDTAILVYTSGTTGKPKGARISHRNALANVKAGSAALPLFEDDERMAFLPMCHVGERIAGCYTSLAAGAKLNFVENFGTVAENVQEIAPTVFGAVPRVWEKFYSTVRMQLSEATALQRYAYTVALGIGERVADHRLAGSRPTFGLRIAFRLARLLVLNNVRRFIGVDRARILITGAAPISPDLVRWYLALGLDLVEGWGQSETSGFATMNRPGAIKLGTVGQPLDGVEIKLSEEGELLVRGDIVFSGYLNLPEKTAETIVDGWLHTGDVGLIDEDGYIHITDRMTDIIITAGGKNITPSEIENELKSSPYIVDAVVIGERRPYLTCLIMLDQENVEKYAQDHSVPFSSYATLCRAEEVKDLIDSEIQRVNVKFARVEQIKKFRIIDKQLSAEDEELTPTMKLKRRVVNEKYKGLVESMY